MRSKLNLWLALVTLALVPTLAGAQDTTAAKIHGHVQDPANAPIANAQVVLSTDGKTALYTFTTDQTATTRARASSPAPITSCSIVTPERPSTALRT